jgi:hypothetical protein
MLEVTANTFIAQDVRSGEVLPGFNHFLDCECGWCVNYGQLPREPLEADMHHRDAMNVLKRESARSISGCYVNPKAPPRFDCLRYLASSSVLST